MIKTDNAPFPIIMKAVNKLVDMVAPTFGPAGNKVIISKDISKVVIDDGVMIAKDFQLEDDFENAVVGIIKDVAVKTNDRVGDGTTSSLIMLRAIMKGIESAGNINTRQISNELKIAVEEAKNQLLAKAKKISKVEDLEKVARISFDDPEIAKVIAGLIHKIGFEGVVAVQDSNTMAVTSEIVEGFDFDKGYISPYMVTNTERLEADLQDPVILITDYRLSIASEIIPIFEKLIGAGHKNIVIVADDVSGDVLATAIINKAQGTFTTLCIQTPGYDSDKADFLNDLAVVTGGTVISKEKGMKLEDFQMNMLGRASRVVSKQTQTVVIGGKGKKSEINTQAFQVKVLQEKATGYKLEQLHKRAAKLLDGVAVIKVGAPTEHEMRALRYKIEDAVNAVKVALKSGIVAGGGLSLARLKTGSVLLNKALQEPHKQLLENSQAESPVIGEHQAWNAVTGEIGDYMKVGVVDPVDVLIAGIESAVSIAILLITTKGIIVEAKEKPNA